MASDYPSNFPDRPRRTSKLPSLDFAVDPIAPGDLVFDEDTEPDRFFDVRELPDDWEPSS
jgi:hypothetical protein